MIGVTVIKFSATSEIDRTFRYVMLPSISKGSYIQEACDLD
jgi:hypothetical protein